MSGIINSAGSRSGVIGPKTFADTPAFYCQLAATQTFNENNSTMANQWTHPVMQLSGAGRYFDTGGDVSNIASTTYNTGGNPPPGQTSTVFIAPIDGVYHLSAFLRIGGIPTTCLYVDLQLHFTGSTLSKSWINLERADSQTDRGSSIGGSVTVEMDAGDGAWIKMYADGGTGAQILASSASFFCGNLIR